MLSKVCAVWLVLLVILPFTAPFSMFDLHEWQAPRAHASGRAPASKTPETMLDHAPLSHAVPLPPRVGRTRLALTRLRIPAAMTVVRTNDGGDGGGWTNPVVPPASRLIALRV